MKKILFIMVALLGLCISSCGNSMNGGSEACDSLKADTVDTVVIDSVAADTLALDSVAE